MYKDKIKKIYLFLLKKRIIYLFNSQVMCDKVKLKNIIFWKEKNFLEVFNLKFELKNLMWEKKIWSTNFDDSTFSFVSFFFKSFIILDHLYIFSKNAI